MRHTFFVVTALVVCCSLAVVPAMAAERTTDRTADRTDRGSRADTPESPGDETILRVPNAPGKAVLGQIVEPIGPESPSGLRSLSTGDRLSKDPHLLVTRAQVLAAQGQTDRAVSMFQQVLASNLPSSPENDKILYTANRELANLLNGASYREVYYLGAALQYVSSATERYEIENRIQQLGGDVFDTTFDNGASTAMHAVRDHTCATATPIAATGVFFSVAPGITVPATYDWFVYTTAAEQVHTIETRPNGASASDDTELALYDACPAASGACDATLGPPSCIAFDDDGGTGFASLISTDCLPAGTYYVEVSGWLDIVAPGSYDLSVGTADCPQDLPLDQYEPDNDRAGSTGISHPNPDPTGNSWGRVNKQTQKHTIALGGDKDFVNFKLHQDSHVRISALIEHGSFFNDFTEVPFDAAGAVCSSAGGACDPLLRVHYGVEPNWGGLCFDNLGFQGNACACSTAAFPGGQVCLSSAAAAVRNAEPRCSDPNDPAYPFPACPYSGTPEGDSCPESANPLYRSHGCYNMQTNVSGDPFGCGPQGVPCLPEPIAIQDDRSATDLSAEMAFCLAATTGGSNDPSVNGDWHVQVTGFGLQQMEYEVRVVPEAFCSTFEVEPNDSFLAPQQITLGDTVNGMANYSATRVPYTNSLGTHLIPATDSDLYAFNPPGVGVMAYSTDSHNSGFTDTFIVLYIGPDPDGNFLFTGFLDDDGGPGVLSSLVMPELPPAPDIFGGTAPDAQYILDVNTAFLQQDYPYTLHTSFAASAAPESEPNDISEGGSPMEILPGGRVNGYLTSCDFDTYKINLADPSLMSFQTEGPMDTIMEIVNCDTASRAYPLACDDDGGSSLSSKISGCLPAGSYCVRVKLVSAFDEGPYDFEAAALSTGCPALDPPLVSAGMDFGCQTGEFGVCP